MLVVSQKTSGKNKDIVISKIVSFQEVLKECCVSIESGQLRGYYVVHHVAAIRSELMLPLLFHPSSSACLSSCFSLQMKKFRREELVLCR